MLKGLLYKYLFNPLAKCKIEMRRIRAYYILKKKIFRKKIEMFFRKQNKKKYLSKYRKLKSTFLLFIKQWFGIGKVRFASIYESAYCHIKRRDWKNQDGYLYK